jgi:Kef-type K+ transport system membrane component KefB
MTNGLVFLSQAAIILVLPNALYHAFRLSGGVPLVVVQILVGIALGPSLFGSIAPGYYHALFSPAALDPLAGLGWIAVLFFAFLTGLHLDVDMVRGHGRGFVAITIASIAVPLVMGFFAALWLAMSRVVALAEGVTPAEFAAGIGICISVTALPVLSAILLEMEILPTRIGQLALGVAAASDIALWISLGALLAAISTRTRPLAGMLITLAVLPVYVATMAGIVGPLTGRIVGGTMRNGRLGNAGLAVVCGVMLASAGLTEVAGLHNIFGAFVAGAVLPNNVRKALLEQLQFVVTGVLMPFYFVLTGLRTLVDFGTAEFWVIFALATASAIVGKMAGTAIVARLAGETWSTALALGALVQTKGLMEVIVLTVMLDAGVISMTVFSALLLMALVTTAIAMPLTRLVMTREPSMAG